MADSNETFGKTPFRDAISFRWAQIPGRRAPSSAASRQGAGLYIRGHGGVWFARGG
jgi:hypothetical protein